VNSSIPAWSLPRHQFTYNYPSLRADASPPIGTREPSPRRHRNLRPSNAATASFPLLLKRTTQPSPSPNRGRCRFAATTGADCRAAGKVSSATDLMRARSSVKNQEPSSNNFHAQLDNLTGPWLGSLCSSLATSKTCNSVASGRHVPGKTQRRRFQMIGTWLQAAENPPQHSAHRPITPLNTSVQGLLITHTSPIPKNNHSAPATVVSFCNREFGSFLAFVSSRRARFHLHPCPPLLLVSASSIVHHPSSSDSRPFRGSSFLL